MANKPLFILLCSREHEKIQMAAMVASVAAVSDRPVTVFVTMSALGAFERRLTTEERFTDSPLSTQLREKGLSDPLDLLDQGRKLGDLTLYACSMALEVHGWRPDDLVEDLFDGEHGLTAFLTAAEGGDLVVF